MPLEGAVDRLVSDVQRVAGDAASAAPALTMPWWLTALHGVAAEVAFWCAILVAVGRAVWLIWDLWERWCQRRQSANRAPAHDLER